MSVPQRARGEAVGLALLAGAVLFNAICLAPELRIGRLPVNDGVLHIAAAERLAEAFRRGEPFLDPWVSEWSLGFPFWRSYQPLPHLLLAGLFALLGPSVGTAAVYAAVQWALLVLLPVPTYVCARLLGLSPLAAGVAAALILSPAESGDLGGYGLGYGAFVWRGRGLFTQLVAIHFLLLALGSTRRALDRGRGRATAAALLAATALSHMVFGYVGFVSALLLAIFGPKHQRSVRLARLVMIVLPGTVLLLWFAIPMATMRLELNRSRWESVWKWDSLGAASILSDLAAGRLFDAERLPVLTALVFLGACAALAAWRRPLQRRLLALAALWLTLWFGRATWGHLLLLAGIPTHLHVHRFQAAFEMAAVLLAAAGVGTVGARLIKRGPAATAVGGLVLLAALAFLAHDRANYLRANSAWGRENLTAREAEAGDLEQALDAVRVILAERPGRVSAGRAADWGGEFKVGSARVFSFLSREHFDQVSFLYHAMSLTSDVMVLHDGSAAHDVAFGVRAVVAPSDRSALPHWRLRGQYGRFSVYETSPEGYFGLVDVQATYVGPRATWYEPSSAWLRSDWIRSGRVIALGAEEGELPRIDRWQPFPPLNEALPCGRVTAENKDGEVYRAHLRLDRACHALVKLTWHRDLVATVDGTPTRLLRVTPGLGAVRVPAGEHTVEVHYEPGWTKAVLLLAGVTFFALWAAAFRRPEKERFEARAAAWLAATGQRLATPRAAAALALLGLSVLALRPLFRAQLIDGHDALSYPPRVVEFQRAVADGHLPPVWAPDLGAGYGQPLFQFAPPLVYAAALPLLAVGLGLTDSLQLALASLFVLGAVCVYRLARRWQAPRSAALIVAAAWLFAPYHSLDLFVRAAFAEAAGLALAPLALLALVRALDRPQPRRIALAGLAMAVLVLAHNVLPLLLFPTFLLFASVRLRFRQLAAAIASVALATGLSAYFWLPALAEMGLVKIDRISTVFSWRDHAVAAWQLLWSPWGFGLSGAGTNDGMSFQLGPVQLLIAAVGVYCARRLAPQHRREIYACAALAAGGAWLATEWSLPLYSYITPLQYLQLPWRALMIPGLFLALIAAPALARATPRIQIAALLLLLAANLSHTATKRYLVFDDEYYAPDSIARLGLSTLTFEEYEPRWVQVRPPDAPKDLRGRGAPLEIRAREMGSARQTFTVTSPADQEVEATTFYYPDWTVSVDERDVATAPLPVRGTITFRLPAGEHRVTIELRPTRLRRIALALSLATALVLIALCARGGRPPADPPASSTVRSSLARFRV